MTRMRKNLNIPQLTFYSARYSWASIAYNDLGIDKYIIHQCLNHSDKNMEITDVYIKRDWSVIDKANRRVLDYVFYGKK